MIAVLVLFQKLAKGRGIEAALGVEPAEQSLVVIGGVLLVEDLDFLDEPVETKADSWVGDAVGRSEFLKRPGRENESLHEGAVFIAKEFGPTLGCGLWH